MRYIALNYFRKYSKIIKNNKGNYILGFIMAVIAGIMLIDFINLVDINNIEIIYMVIFIYSMAKLFQDIPVINISYQILEFKIVRLWQIKLLVLAKCFYPSYIVLSVLYLFPRMFNKLSFSALLLLGIINVVSNIMCFFISQSKKRGILRITTVIVLLSVYLLKLIYLGIILMVGGIVKFLSVRYINYDLLLPYAHLLSDISEGLVSGNTQAMSTSQSLLIKAKSYSNLNLIEKYYDKSNYLVFSKEISRATYYEKNLINISVTSFIISFSLMITNISSKLVFLGAFILIICLCDNFLRVMDNIEKINKNKGLYYPYTFKELFIQKYTAQICIIIIPFLLSRVLLNYISLFSYILCILLLPIKGIADNYYSRNKIGHRCVNTMISILCLSNLL